MPLGVAGVDPNILTVLQGYPLTQYKLCFGRDGLNYQGFTFSGAHPVRNNT